jgi:hypothetical protein
VISHNDRYGVLAKNVDRANRWQNRPRSRGKDPGSRIDRIMPFEVTVDKIASIHS